MEGWNTSELLSSRDLSSGCG